MKILVIGTGESQFVKEPIEFSLLNGGHDIYVTYNCERSELYKDFYEDSKINILDTNNKTSFWGRVPKIGVLYNLLSAVRSATQDKKFDVIHLHSVSNYILTWFVVNVLSKYTSRLVCTCYGSDLFLRTDDQLNKFKKLFRKMDAISIATDNLIGRFKKAFGKEFDEKLYKVPFGLSNLIAIDSLNGGKDSKTVLGLKNDNVVIAIGHNTSMEQQHLKVLEILGHLPDDIKKCISVVLQLTYGNGTAEYINAVERAARKIGCEVLVLREYMNSQEVAIMTTATDLYINSQVSDAISGAMLEYLYAGAKVLNPVWIDYSELLNNGCNYYIYNDFNELNDLIIKVVNNKGVVDTSNNHDVIYNLSHWNAHVDKWRKFLGIEMEKKECSSEI